MVFSASELERKQLCEVLYRNKLDYNHLDDEHYDAISKSIEGLALWTKNRGGPIKQEVLNGVFNNSIKPKLKRGSKGIAYLAAKSLLMHDTYKNSMTATSFLPIDIQTSSGITFTDTIPAIFTEYDGTRNFFFIRNDVDDKDDFLLLFSSFISTVWSFYNLNSIPVLHNISYNKNDGINILTAKISGDYIMQSRRILIDIAKKLRHNIPTLQSSQICKYCDNKTDCKRRKFTKG